jgi:sulfate transport system substrate-binding protein
MAGIKVIGRWLHAGTAAALVVAATAAHADTSILNVSYDVTRELYKDINASFAAAYKQQTGETVTIKQSHGASSAQALSVLQGLQADVVTMNQPNDIDLLAERGQLLSKDWRARFPDNSSPYSTTMVFLVRKGNPKAIKDWSDLAKPGVQVVIANPKTSGNGRYAYLAAWGYQKQKGATDQQALDFEKAIFRNVPVLDSGGRGATTTFTQRGIGDVLVTFENEVALMDTGASGAQFDAVYPSASILAEPPVAVVDKVVDKGHAQGRAGLSRLSVHAAGAGDRRAAPSAPARSERAEKHAAEFKPLKTFSVEQVFGSWANAQKTHFADGGTFDRVIVDRK